MLGKIFVYPGNKASDKVSLVSSLVIIKVYINSLSMLQEHNATFLKKKLERNKKKKKTKPSILTLKNKKWMWDLCVHLVVASSRILVVYKKGVEEEPYMRKPTKTTDRRHR